MGLACATRFAVQGAKVGMADVLDDLGLGEAKRLGATYLHCDVSNSKDVKATVTPVVGEFGHVDSLMNNAAISISCNFLEISKADHDRVMDTDLKGWFAMLQAARDGGLGGKSTAARRHRQHVVGEQRSRHCDNRSLLHGQRRRFLTHTWPPPSTLPLTAFLAMPWVPVPL